MSNYLMEEGLKRLGPRAALESIQRVGNASRGPQINLPTPVLKHSLVIHHYYY